MSVVTHQGIIAPALWPNNLGRSDSGPFAEMQLEDDWRYVPESYEGLCDSLLVVKKGDDDGDVAWSSRALVHHPQVLPIDMRAQMRPFVVVLQGFLGDFNISPLGNWDNLTSLLRRDRSAHAAVQYVTLESGGGAGIPFNAQVDVLNNLRAFIRAKVGAELDEEREGERDMDHIVLERSVFTKVRPSGTQAPAVRLSTASDPGGKAMKLAKVWRVDHVIQTGARQENGQTMAIVPTALRRGDFVEVSVFAEIQYGRRQRRTGSVVRFAMKEVVRLWSAEDAAVSDLLPA
ncbi:hypothetical protein C2E23DRAFT_859609 [Lenzites betulinus]|nr:hypothetical protein C2E23DRAFT_859609 [Lenzites betulinus]